MRWALAAALLLTAGLAHAQMTPARLRVLADAAVKVETATSWGSGTAIGKRTVLTCEHVVHGDKAKTILIKTTLADGSSDMIPAQVVKADEKLDLALLYVDADLPHYARVASSDVFDFVKVWKISSPGGDDRTVSEEIINKTSDDPTMWRLTGSEMKGSSGGGIFDDDGNLQCVFARLWVLDYKNPKAPEASSGVMGYCVKRSEVAKFLRAAK